MSSNIYITPSTSLVLIKSLAQPTNIYLSTLQSPDFQVKIRDATGSSNLLTNPINISTIGGARFTNNTTYYAINQPFGFVNLSLRTSTLWQILHTSGQTPSQSAADVTQMNLSTTYIGWLSAATKRVSSLQLQNLETPNSIQLVGPFVVGNLSTPGFIQFQSTMNVYGNASFEETLFISGATQFQSTLFANELLPLQTVFRTYSNIGVGGSVHVAGVTQVVSTLHTRSSLQVASLAVQASTSQFVNQATDLRIAGLLSTLKDIQTTTLRVQENLRVTQTVSTLDGLLSSGTLQTGGNLWVFSTLSTVSSAFIANSVSLEGAFTIQTALSTVSSVTLPGYVSSVFLTTNSLSSATSFSTAGSFTVLSTLTVKGSLSTNALRVRDTVSVGTSVYSFGPVSTFGEGQVLSLLVDTTALVRSLSTQQLGIGGQLFVNGNAQLGTLSFPGELVTASNLTSRGATFFQSTVGVAKDITVRGNMTIQGLTTIATYDVTSYGISTLDIITSSPSIALKASTFLSPLVTSDRAALLYNSNTGTISTGVQTDILADLLYAKTLRPVIYSTGTLVVNTVQSDQTRVPSASLPQFEILQKSWFPRGLSSAFVRASTIEATTLQGSFIGSAENLSNVGLLFSTISSSYVLASTVQSQFVSANKLYLQDMNISSKLTVNRLFEWGGVTGSAYIVSSMLNFTSTEQAYLSTLYFPKPTLEQIGPSTLVVNRFLYLNAANERVGVNLSSPQYNFDISGSLFCSGFQFDEQNTLQLSTTKPVVFFSSISYSSIYLRDALVVNAISSGLAAIGEATPFQLEDTSRGASLYIAERRFPYTTANNSLPGLFQNPSYSTIDFSLTLFIYNATRNVGMNTILEGTSNTILPLSIPSSFDLYMNSDFVASNVYVSSITGVAKLAVSSLTMPTLGLNPLNPSTLNTFSTASVSSFFINQFVEFNKSAELKGGLFIKRPLDMLPPSDTFAVFGSAYISSVTIEDLKTTTFSMGFQDL